jgi:hypothetical protein
MSRTVVRDAILPTLPSELLGRSIEVKIALSGNVSLASYHGIARIQYPKIFYRFPMKRMDPWTHY